MQGQTDQADVTLTEARTMATALGSRRVLWPVLMALSQLDSNQNEVKWLHHQAREIVNYIADHVENNDLRASFLELPQVQTVFASI